MRRAVRRALAISILLFSVCDVGSRASAQTSHTNAASPIDSAVFNRDTLVFYGAPGSTRLANEFSAYVRAMPPLPGLPANTQPSRMKIFLAQDERTFAAMTGGVAPHWGAGVAQPDSGIIVLPAYTSRRAGVQDLGPVIRHEIAHIELQRALKDLRIPVWFTEGYAVVAAGQLDPDAAWYLRLAFLSKRAPPLDSLELEWPAGEIDARVAYLLSASAVEYLRSSGDDAQFAAFLSRWKASGSFEQAMRATYLISSTQFETLWAKYVRRHYGWVLFAAQGAVVWLFISVLAVALIILRRRRDRRRLEEMKKAEIPDAPAYWIPGQEDESEPPQDGPDGLTQAPETDKLPP